MVRTHYSSQTLTPCTGNRSEVLTSCTLSQQAIHLTSKHETTSKELYLEESKILHSNTLINLHSGAGFSPNKLL